MHLLENLYYRQAFFPGWIGVFINPFYIARVGLLNAIAQLSPMLNGKLLDVGCGTKPYRELFNVDTYVGLEFDSVLARKRNVADLFYDGIKFPIANEQFDSVLCNQVLEHVFNPNQFLGEIKRILKKDGRLLLTLPFVWDEHEQPYDYARYSSFGLKALLEKNGFKVVKYNKIGADVSTIFQLMNAYLYKVTNDLPKPVRVLFIVSIMALFNIFGLLFSRILPKNPDLFLDHIVLAEKNS